MPNRTTLQDPSRRLTPLRGVHLAGFECITCGTVDEHETAIEIMGEVLVCWPCAVAAVWAGADADADECSACWPQECPACPGFVAWSGAEHQAHVAEAHT